MLFDPLHIEKKFFPFPVNPIAIVYFGLAYNHRKDQRQLVVYCQESNKLFLFYASMKNLFVVII